MDGGKCILQLRGVRPFMSHKYDLTQHPNYKYTSDYDPKNAFKIEEYLHHKIRLYPDDEFKVIDADTVQEKESQAEVSAPPSKSSPDPDKLGK